MPALWAWLEAPLIMNLPGDWNRYTSGIAAGRQAAESLPSDEMDVMDDDRRESKGNEEAESRGESKSWQAEQWKRS